MRSLTSGGTVDLFGCAEHPTHNISDTIANRFKNKVEDRLSEGNMKAQLSHGR